MKTIRVTLMVKKLTPARNGLLSVRV